MGHADEEIGDIYSQLETNVKFRREVAERIGLGFDLPTQSTAVTPNAPKEVDHTPVGSVA
jgi:hypothetical protein